MIKMKYIDKNINGYIDKNINEYIDDFRDIADLFEFFTGLDSNVFRLVIEIFPDSTLDILYKIEIFTDSKWISLVESTDISKMIKEFKEKYNSSVEDEEAKI